MSVYNPVYNPTGYLTNIYAQLVPENPYTPFYPGPPADQYVPCHWTPDSNQVFYAPSISQGIPPGWRHPPAFPANGNNPFPAAAPAPPKPMDNYSPPHLPFSAQVSPSSRQQRVEAYIQQHNEVLRFLCLSPMEFARCTCTLLTHLGYPNTSVTLEVWAD
ncbi:hypothetical protein C0989_004426 [Termitomyces sp. Mn162]|nr:hypothetical protein C0989_004426 [Termitomyces sp. Mn162]